MKKSFLVLILISVVASVVCTNYFFNNKSKDVKLTYSTKVKYGVLPLQKRVKYFTYNSAHPIKAINCFDLQNSKASVNITEGGIGFNHVTLRMKSQWNSRLEYSIDIYV